MEELKNKVNRNLFKYLFRKRKKNNDLKKRYLMKWLIIIKKNKTNEKNKMKKRKILEKYLIKKNEKNKIIKTKYFYNWIEFINLKKHENKSNNFPIKNFEKIKDLIINFDNKNNTSNITKLENYFNKMKNNCLNKNTNYMESNNNLNNEIFPSNQNLTISVKFKNEEKNKVNIHLINNKNLDNQDKKLSPKLSNYKDNKNNNNLNNSLINHKTKNEKIKSLYLRLNEENDLTSYQNKFKLMKEKKKIRNRTQENFYDNSKLISVTKTLDKNNLNEKRDIYLNLNENYYKVKNKSGKSKSQEKQRKILKNSSFDNNNSYVYQNSIMRKIRLFLIKIIKRLDYSNILKKKLNKWRFISNDNELKNLNLQKYKLKAKQNKRYRKSSSSDKSKIQENNEISITENLQRPKRIKKDKILISIYKKKNPFEQMNPISQKYNYKTSTRNIEKYKMKNENNTNLTDMNITQKHYISLNDSSLDKSIDSKLSPVIYKYSKENNALLHSNIDYYRSSNDDSFHNEEYLQVLKQQNKFLLSHKMLLIYRKFHEDKNKQLKKFIKKWRSKNGYFTNYLNIYFHIIRKNNHCITCTCNIKCNLNGCVLSNYTDCMKCYCENTFNLLKKIMFSLYGLREVNIERYIFHLWYKKVFYKKLDS